MTLDDILCPKNIMLPLWSSNTKSFSCKGEIKLYFDKLGSPACGVFDYRSNLLHFRGGNTPAHRQDPVTMTGLLPTRNT